MSLIMNGLLSHLSIAWTFRVLGFITLAVTLPAAMLLKERTIRPVATIDW